ncbi:MAG TPA: hypothetical protein VEX62_00230 [Candidatus Limnocylindrales bacterium]|nr:hypothetical protein [Candidatus Limnocylindrales bacterium]
MLAAAALVLASLLAACTVPAASPSPTLSPTASPSNPALTPAPDPSESPAPVGEVTSAAQAAALVFASDDQFAQMVPLRTDMVGQSAWYEATETADGFTVAITIGSGDCQAGCIDRHVWTYDVARDGTITLVADEGDDVEFSPSAGTNAPVILTVNLVAGPVCPVEQIPPAENCAPRPVADAEIVVRAPDGSEAGRATSDADGVVQFELDAGAYFVELGDVEGLMRRPEAQAFSAVGGDMVGLLLGYDTGIR